MRNPEGESDRSPLRPCFDRRLKLEFHGSRVTSDAGLLTYRRFDHNAVRLQLLTLADNFGNLLRTLALPDAVEHWLLTTLRAKLIKVGTDIVRRGRNVTFQMTEVPIPRALFADILRHIDRLRPKPSPA